MSKNNMVKDEEKNVEILLKKYLGQKKKVSNKVLDILYPKEKFGLGFNTSASFVIDRDDFLRLLPLFMYKIKDEYIMIKYINIGSWHHSYKIIDFLNMIYIIHDRYNIQYEYIFEYLDECLIKEVDIRWYDPCIIPFLERWMKYLDLIKRNKLMEYSLFPENLINSYNNLLIKCGEKQEVFYLKECNLFVDPTCNVVMFEGIIPIDSKGDIRMDLLNIQVKNEKKVSVVMRSQMMGCLKIEVKNGTIIKIKRSITDTKCDIISYKAKVGKWNGNNLKEFRINVLKLSQRDLAKRYGVNVDTVRNWENNRSEPSGKLYDTIRKDYEMFNVCFNLYTDYEASIY